MPAYKSYPTVANTPNRGQRKLKRKTTFEFNRTIAKVNRKARRLARKGLK